MDELRGSVEHLDLLWNGESRSWVETNICCIGWWEAEGEELDWQSFDYD